jgi:hypothetical protein
MTRRREWTFPPTDPPLTEAQRKMGCALAKLRRLDPEAFDFWIGHRMMRPHLPEERRYTRRRALIELEAKRLEAKILKGTTREAFVKTAAGKAFDGRAWSRDTIETYLNRVVPRMKRDDPEFWDAVLTRLAYQVSRVRPDIAAHILAWRNGRTGS